MAAALPEAAAEIRYNAIDKGRGFFSRRDIKKGEILVQERPLVSAQFAWNSLYNYTACDFCMKSLESAEAMCQRLSANSSIQLPFPENDGNNPLEHTRCPHCQVLYCSNQCCEEAWKQYHQTLCLGPSPTPDHPLVRLQEAWRNMHFPPETATVMLIARILATVRQSSNKQAVLAAFSNFCCTAADEEEEIAHKLLGSHFQDQIATIRTLVTEALFDQDVEAVTTTSATLADGKGANVAFADVFSGILLGEEQCESLFENWLTPAGFQSLIAMIGTNGQGIGSSSLSVWVHACDAMELSPDERKKLDEFIDQLYVNIEKESGTFLNCEGSGLYASQSACNHSCMPNAEVSFPNNNFNLVLTATEDIPEGEEIFISYLDECQLERSRHSRQKALRENYIFNCNCRKCKLQAGDPDETSEDEEEDMDDDDDDDE